MASSASGNNSSTSDRVDSYVIVAIPSKDDYVWNISSEKIPHLTLLYTKSKFDDLGRVVAHIQHVIDTTMRGRFYLDVESRGVLGDNLADVLFLQGYDLKKLKEFRGHLLSNDDIRKAYDSVEQYPKWTPHLTLGYPETPAKPDKRDYPGIHSISFDRIALWTGDYEGVEFPLKQNSLPVPDDFAMSISKGKNYLEHYGIKGMKWGVIRKQGASLVMPSDDAVKAQVVRGKAKLGGVHTLSNKELQTLIRRMDLEVKFKDLKDVQHNQSLIGKGSKWAGRVITDILVGVTVSWLRRPSFTGGGKSRPHGGSTVPVKAVATVDQRAIGR